MLKIFSIIGIIGIIIIINIINNNNNSINIIIMMYLFTMTKTSPNGLTDILTTCGAHANKDCGSIFLIIFHGHHADADDDGHV